MGTPPRTRKSSARYAGDVRGERPRTRSPASGIPTGSRSGRSPASASSLRRQFAEIVKNYPGGAPEVEVGRIVGSRGSLGRDARQHGGSRRRHRRLLVGRVADDATRTARSTTASTLIELRDGIVWRETVYWAPTVRRARVAAPVRRADAQAGRMT